MFPRLLVHMHAAVRSAAGPDSHAASAYAHAMHTPVLRQSHKIMRNSPFNWAAPCWKVAHCKKEVVLTSVFGYLSCIT